MKQNGKETFDDLSQTAFTDELRVPVSHASGGTFVTELAMEFNLSEERATQLLEMTEEYLADRIVHHPKAPDGLRVMRRAWRHILCARTWRQQAF